jgi:cytochrome oxidase Cu insertion factor (SCO1/SenC/PrrC family)
MTPLSAVPYGGRTTRTGARCQRRRRCRWLKANGLAMSAAPQPGVPVGPLWPLPRAVRALAVPVAWPGRMGRDRASLIRAGAAVLLLPALALGLGACGSQPPAPSANFGTIFPEPRPVPTTPLVNEDGQKMSLASFRGKYVVLAPFLTLCQEECPLTTGVYQELQASVGKAGLGDKVAFVDWTLLTGTSADISAFWRPFGVWYQKVPEEKPAQIDWWTGRPLTYDVDHDDGFILISPSGHERFITLDIPDLHGELAVRLRALLDSQGLQYLDHGALERTTPSLRH